VLGQVDEHEIGSAGCRGAAGSNYLAGFVEGGFMKLEERESGDVTILTITGEITLSAGGDVQLKDKIQSLLQQGRKKILLDLGGVSYVDSAGLGQLVQATVTASKNGGKLKLLNLTKRLNDLLVVTKLSTVFDVVEKESDF
jgi:anti-sigma B factor antagonist